MIRRHISKLIAFMLVATCVVGLLLKPALSMSNPSPNVNISTEQVNTQLIKDYYAAYAAGDLNKIKSFFDPEIVWRIPGHHPLAGEKRGPDEVAAFFTQLREGKFKADPIFFQAQGDYVVDIHRGWSNVEDNGAQVDQLYTLLFTIKNGKIVGAQNFVTDQYQADAFFWRMYPLKPLPDRLAGSANL